MHFSIQGLLFKKQNKQEQFLKKIKKREEITDTIELEIAEYLTKISSYNLTETATRRIRGIHSMINDLERIGDIYYQMSKTFERMQNEGTMLNEDSMEGIRKMLNLIHEAIRNVRDNLEKDSENIDLEKAMEIENAINDYQDKLLEYHYNQLENKVYSN
ncbi:PhoU domain-containing protein [Gracilimonas sp.]|uniref:PhoU domain-containing protein n=1 Tax=Gracilimonas sp. TaxID=1974203 RepID=UPI0025C6E55B|nr:PhoU domain-containing protein [Gracilimonas sp.]